MLTKRHFNPNGNQLFHHETDWNFWKDFFLIMVGHSLFPLTSNTSSFVGLCSTLLKREQELVERPHHCDVSAAAAGASVGHRRSGRNSLEPNAVKVRVSLSMLRQSLSILKQLGSASKWVLFDSVQVTAFEMWLKKKKKKLYIMLFCCDVLHQIRKLRSVSYLWQNNIEGEFLGFICASSGLRKCHTQLVFFFFFNYKCHIRKCQSSLCAVSASSLKWSKWVLVDFERNLRLLRASLAVCWPKNFTKFSYNVNNLRCYCAACVFQHYQSVPVCYIALQF